MVIVGVVALLQGCAGGDPSGGGGDGDPGGDPAAIPEPAGAVVGAGADVDRWGIPDLALTPLGSTEHGWDTVRAARGRLYTRATLEGGRSRYARLDPATGDVLAEVQLELNDGWTITPDGVVMLSLDRRYLSVRDLDTLEELRTVDLGADARAGLNSDLPRSSELWLGLRILNEDMLQGVVTRMEAVRLDLPTGAIVDRRPAPPCGAGSVMQLDERVVAMGVACAEQVATLDLVSSELQTYEAFPVGAQLLAHEGAAFIRWKELGYLGKVVPGAAALQTLDLNAGGPVLVDLLGQVVGPRGIWVVGITADDAAPEVLNLIDPTDFTVVARARMPNSGIGFVDGVGYALRDGGLTTFDPDSVTGGKPTSTVRPTTGAPPPVEPHTEEEQAVLEAFALVFDASEPNDAVAANLVADPEVLAARQRIQDVAARVWPGVEVVPTALSLDGDSAALNYVFLLDGRTAFPPQVAQLERVGGTWMVSAETICNLAELAAVAQC
jgi:hypothetical protein